MQNSFSSVSVFLAENQRFDGAERYLCAPLEQEFVGAYVLMYTIARHPKSWTRMLRRDSFATHAPLPPVRAYSTYSTHES